MSDVRNKLKSAKDLAGRLRRRFPDLVQAINGNSAWSDSDIDAIERFAGIVSRSACKGSGLDAITYFQFILEEYERGSGSVKNIIEVYFVCQLFLQISAELTGRGWLLVPEKFKIVYVDFWGRPPFLQK
ncbi:MAG: hypothetical protein ABL901_21510 [Hyphomicrobiaceae bacterium]